MTRPSKPSGMTLIEVTLAITLGVVLIAGATLIYNQARESVSSSRMKTRVMTVAALVEELFARDLRYPTAAQLRSLYGRRLPDEHLVNPWRGPVGADATKTDESGQERKGIHFVSQAPGSSLGGADTLAAGGALDLRGAVQYNLVTANATASYYDKTRSKAIEYRGFSVSGINDRNEDGHHVTGPRLHEN